MFEKPTPWRIAAPFLSDIRTSVRIMDRGWLAAKLEAGRSIESIAREVGRDPSTISYWAAKYGLESAHAGRHAARGSLTREQLASLVGADLTVAQIAVRVDRSPTTVRHWLAFHGLRTTATARRRKRVPVSGAAASSVVLGCAKHGRVRHVLHGSGYYRCARCNSEAVSRRRRAIKRRLVEEAGGSCVLCGYDGCIAALHFHHVDPSTKRFHLSLKGLARALDTVRQEAQKCVLLCANCHAEVEAGITRLPDQCTGRG